MILNVVRLRIIDGFLFRFLVVFIILLIFIRRKLRGNLERIGSFFCGLFGKVKGYRFVCYSYEEKEEIYELIY